MRVIVDPVLCEGNGMCVQVAAEIFELADDEKARVLVEHVDEARRAEVETAVRRCPRRAIRIARD